MAEIIALVPKKQRELQALQFGALTSEPIDAAAERYWWDFIFNAYTHSHMLVRMDQDQAEGVVRGMLGIVGKELFDDMLANDHKRFAEALETAKRVLDEGFSRMKTGLERIRIKDGQPPAA